MTHVRRFVFVSYEDLLQVRFKKLESVSDRVFVFVGASVEAVPLQLVRQVQDMGRALRWVTIEDADPDAAARILSFHVGTTHQQVDVGVEFAILSDDARYEPLLAHLTAAGRSCVRVRQRRAAAPVEDTTPSDATISKPTPVTTPPPTALESPTPRWPMPPLSTASPDAPPLGAPSLDAPPLGAPALPLGAASLATRQTAQAQATSPPADERIATLADEVVRRLIRSGMRPVDLQMLRSYIVLHSEGSDSVRYVDAIVAHLDRQGELSVDGTQVGYNF